MTSQDPTSNARGDELIFGGNLDPTVTAVNAPKGAIYISDLTLLSYTKQDNGLTTNWIISSFELLSGPNTIYADSNASSGGDGTLTKPFSSLQDAIDAAEALGAEVRKTIYVAAGSAFDEDVKVTGGLLAIIGTGPFTLGDAAGSAFSSTTPRNFTWESAGALTNGKWPSLIIGTLNDEESTSTHTAYMNAFTISGDFLYTDPSNFNVSANIQMRNVKIVGSYDTTDTAGGLQTYLKRVHIDGPLFDSPSGILNIIDSCQFDPLVTCLQYCRLLFCEFRSGMTVSSPPVNSLPPRGMYGSDFKGVFTGPASSLLLDAAANYFFVSNGASLAGGATKVLIHDLT